MQNNFLVDFKKIFLDSFLFKYRYSILIFVFIIFTTVITVSSIPDWDKSYKQFNGIILTDKSGQAYMLQYTMFNNFKIQEFDLNKMKLRN